MPFRNAKNISGQERPKASQEAKTDAWDPGKGDKTLPHQDRKSICRNYEVRTQFPSTL